MKYSEKIIFQKRKSSYKISEIKIIYIRVAKPYVVFYWIKFFKEPSDKAKDKNTKNKIMLVVVSENGKIVFNVKKMNNRENYAISHRKIALIILLF